MAEPALLPRAVTENLHMQERKSRSTPCMRIELNVQQSHLYTVFFHNQPMQSVAVVFFCNLDTIANGCFVGIAPVVCRIPSFKDLLFKMA